MNNKINKSNKSGNWLPLFITMYFPNKNSPNWTKSETNLESLYEKIIDINNLKTFILLEKFKMVA